MIVSSSVRTRIVAAPREVENNPVCLFVSHAPTATVKRYVRFHLQELARHGYVTILILNVDDVDRFPDCAAANIGATVLRRNWGFDFGAWADALRIFPDLWKAERILLLNDSVFGPVCDYSKILQIAAQIPADLVGMTESHQPVPHLQSYFLMMKSGMLNNDHVRLFWQDMVNYPSKQDVIRTYEIPLLYNCRRWGLRCAAIFPHRSKYIFNPTHILWRQLIIAGFPYIKVELLRDNPGGLDLSGWREMVTDKRLIPMIDEQLEYHKTHLPPAVWSF
ncbi:MAG TPA: rhamnan synthesis F family protein [Pseudorhodoplanes sp.]|nr:rhamnan synthesis F family protein [Pseudorhodoplanes sp.]